MFLTNWRMFSFFPSFPFVRPQAFHFLLLSVGYLWIQELRYPLLTIQNCQSFLFVFVCLQLGILSEQSLVCSVYYQQFCLSNFDVSFHSASSFFKPHQPGISVCVVIVVQNSACEMLICVVPLHTFKLRSFNLLQIYLYWHTSRTHCRIIFGGSPAVVFCCV